MRYILLLTVLSIFSCKSKTDCNISQLGKTINYKVEFEKYRDFIGDSLIIFEEKKLKKNLYRTIFDLREHEQYVWLIKESSNKTDSLLIHYEDIVEYFYIIESEFDLSKCEIIISEENHHNPEAPWNKTIKRIKL